MVSRVKDTTSDAVANRGEAARAKQMRLYVYDSERGGRRIGFTTTRVFF